MSSKKEFQIAYRAVRAEHALRLIQHNLRPGNEAAYNGYATSASDAHWKQANRRELRKAALRVEALSDFELSYSLPARLSFHKTMNVIFGRK